MCFRIFSLFSVSLASFIFLNGCGKSLAIPVVVPVSGIVTLDGQPLANASLTFISSDPKVKNGVAVSDAKGKFEVLTYFDSTHILKGIVAGEYKVTVTKADDSEPPPPVIVAPKKEDRVKMQEENFKKMLEFGKKTDKKRGVPEIYSNPSTSGLKAIATAGMEPLKIDL